jgi:serine/threonine-protein phosphatase PGAM5
VLVHEHVHTYTQEDEKRILTPLGRQQAALTGQRLAELLEGDVPITSIRVSTMTRAKETAEIIATYLPGLELSEPDPLLSEGRPCHHIPGGKASPKTIQMTDENHPRIESAFQKYFYRADYHPDSKERHEVEIIVCHANVIRYFLCRALQLPPEAWLRYCPFNCSLTYFTVRPTGTVSCRLVGDSGHLPYQATTFSQHEGYLW